MAKEKTLEEQVLLKKPAIRAAYKNRKRVIEIGGTKFAIQGHTVKNVTYLTVKPTTPMLSTPVLNFPLDENEYRREMESRGAKIN